MAPIFVFPRTLEELEHEDEDNRLYVHNPINIASFHSSQLEEFVKGVSFDLSDKEILCVEEQDVFDRVYSLLRGYSTLSPSSKLNLVETLRSNLTVLLPNVDSLSRVSDDHIPLASHRNAFKIYTFFLVHILLAQDSDNNNHNAKAVGASSRKKQPANSWNWEPQRARILNLIANSLEINLELLFGSPELDEGYLSFITKNAFYMFENVTLLKDSDAKDALCRIIGACATKYRYTEQSCASVMHLIHKYDFVVTHMADAVAAAEKKYADGSLATSLVREIGRTNPKDYVKDTVGAENVGRFLVELADRIPKLISTNIGILVPHFGGDSYKIRNALVGVLGKLMAKAFKDVDAGEVTSKSIRLRTKQAMLEILLERCRDVSAYTRSRVLQVWAELCEEHSISIGLWNKVAEVAAGRLEDKGAMVRKSALSLLIMMLQHNPFGPQLRIASFEATLDQYRKKLKELEPPGGEEPSSNSDNFNGDGEVDDLNSETVAKEPQQDSLIDSCLSQTEDAIPLQNSSVPDVGNLEQTRALVASLEAGLRFSKCIGATMPTLVQLMASSSATDVENTILLLMRCKQFQIDGSEECLRKMLPLVFSQDKSIYEAVESAFHTIYIRKSPIETAKNLLNLATDSNIGDLAALEFIVGALVSKGDISSSTISALWDFFCFNVGGTTAEQSRGALSVLCMVAKTSTGVLGSHLQDIIDIGFGRWSKVDPLLARTACLAIQRLSEDDKKKLLASNSVRIFGILESLITGIWLPMNIWYAAADKAIAAIYAIHPTPETIAANMIKKSLSSVCNDGGVNVLSDTDTSSGSMSITVQVAKLSRCLFVISHIAMNQLVYIESCGHKIQKQKLQKEKRDSENQSIDSNGKVQTGTLKDNDINAELGFSASEDAALDALFEKAEKEIVSGGSNEKNLIGICATFLSKLCRNFGLMQKYPELQASAMLALCRLMIIDADFCDANLQLLFTVVESSQSEIVRSNCTIALGDLAVRFPNLLEPWTENMYARLKDPCVSVRKNAVLVLSHLILNDMMKVKGYINEMAVRLEDEDERISNLAKLFFLELSKKGNNPIYNLLPDILSRLSQQNLGKDSFCNIMQFLIASIKKDRQMEALVEKLCNRFSGVTDVRQWEYISYCLSQLSFTEKGMKKLIELFTTYEHVLSEDSVMDNFRNILNKGKKFAKVELKSCIEEFEDKLNKFHAEKKEQEVTARNAQIHQQKIGSREGFTVAINSEDHTESNTASDETDSEVVDGSTEETAFPSNGKSKSNLDVSETFSGASSELTESDQEDMEVQSPRVTRGVPRSRTNKSNVKDGKGDNISVTKRKIIGSRRYASLHKKKSTRIFIFVLQRSNQQGQSILNCTSFPPVIGLQVNPNISSEIVGGNGFLCVLRPPSSSGSIMGSDRRVARWGSNNFSMSQIITTTAPKSSIRKRLERQNGGISSGWDRELHYLLPSLGFLPLHALQLQKPRKLHA
ncbi:condensin complex subunit 1 [Abrus precatorius]|uniref:Condensin-1 complex subunit CAP-D2 n=1 Tax=Abrus precatorius TaxID=3816 RepID=A0A8B8M743_ABRPR|nr:condensin complex subunit 1 [Abrus precatorius]